jgi:DNA-binding CsgD family transcriptional regulator
VGGQRIDLVAATFSTVAFDRRAPKYVLSRTPILDHGVAMVRALLNELDLSYHTDGLPDRDIYLTVASTCLNDALPGDTIGWGGAELTTTPALKLWFNETVGYGLRTAFDAVFDQHPIVAHRRTNPGSQPVLRASDCSSDREFRLSRVYRELFLPIGARYQLAIVTATDNPITSGRSWFINRSTRDFTDADLRQARHLQPMLALLDTVYSSSSPIHRVEGAQTDEARKRAHLTVRELDVLILLADGRSAQQIARLRRISVRTVRKHLENIYEKLGCHDRMLAVNKARQLGLLRSQ